MKVPEGKNGVQQEENSYETSTRMDYDDTNADIIVEDKGTDEPAVKISKKNPRKGINDEALAKAEERFKSERTYKEVGIGDTTRDGVILSKANDTCVEIKGTEDEYDSEPDLSSGKTNKGSIHTETFDPIEVINEI